MIIEKVENGYRATVKLQNSSTVQIVAKTRLKALMWALWGVKKGLKANNSKEWIKEAKQSTRSLTNLSKVFSTMKATLFQRLARK